MTHIFVGMIWKGDPIHPYILFHEYHESIMCEKLLQVGSRLDIEFLGGTFCIGSETNKGIWLPCSVNNAESSPRPLLTGKQCVDCSSLNFFTCRARCQGEVCNPIPVGAKTYCIDPATMIYLTNIAGIDKVGVSLGLPRRWIEQGSDLAIHIASAPGLEARRVEYHIGSRLGVRTQIRTSEKLQLLNGITFEEGERRLKQLAERCQPILEEVLDGIPGIILKNPNVVDLRKYYGEVEFNRVTVKNVVKGKQFGGVITAIKGSILIVQEGEYCFALDLKQMIGTRFKFLDHPASQLAESSVDDYF